MNTKSHLRGKRTALSIALLSLLPSLVRAADTSLLSSNSVSLSNLSMQVLDFNNTDGVTAGIRFQGTTLLNSSGLAYDYETSTYSYTGPQYNNSLLPVSAIQYTTDDGTGSAVANTNSITAQTQLTLSNVQNNASEYLSTYNKSLTATSTANAGVTYNTTDLSDIGSVTLTAHTAVVIRGTISASWSTDATAIQDWMAEQNYAYWQLNHYADLTAVFGVTTQNSDITDKNGISAGYLISYSGAYLNLSPSYDGGLNQDSVSLQASNFASKAFEITLVNLGDTDLTSQLTLDVHTFDQLSLSAWSYLDSPVDPTPTIPEPSTYALMGLGLVSITLATRRRRVH